MSIDNGIYILETRTTAFAKPTGSFDWGNLSYQIDLAGSEPYDYEETEPYEYRIEHLSAIENLYGDSEDTKVWIENARRMFKSSFVFYDRGEAMDEASKMYDDVIERFGVCEHGIQIIDIPEIF